MINTGLDDLRYSIYNSVCGWKVLNNNCNPALNVNLTVDTFGGCSIWSLNRIAPAPPSTTTDNVVGTTALPSGGHLLSYSAIIVCVALLVSLFL